MDIKFTLTLVVSFGALLFSFLNYRRSRRFENENHLYQLKIETYSKILGELSVLLNGLEDNLEEAEEYFKNPSKESFDALNEQADAVDELCFSFKDFIVNNSLIIPELVLASLEKFVDKVLDTETLDTDTQNKIITLKDIEKAIDELSTQADSINELLRKDLRIEELNMSLYRRLK